MNKRLLLLLFTALSLLPLYAYDFEVDGIYYNINSGTSTCSVTLSNTNGYSGNIVIPKSVTYNSTEYSVTEIGDYAFYRSSGLNSVTIPKSVTAIGNGVFNGCTALTSLIIEDGESTLSLGYNEYCEYWSYNTGKGLFYDCPLESLYLGRNLSYNTDYNSGYSPFYYKRSLKKVTIGNLVTTIGKNAFWDCSGLSSVIIPNSVTSVTQFAFSGCSGLIKSAYPNTIFDPFSYGITIEYPAEDSIFENGVIFSQEENTIYFVPIDYVGDLKIPDSVTEIGGDAFRACSGLTSVKIGNSVTSIGCRAFSDCSGLTSVVIPNSVTTIDDNAFVNCI